MPIGSVGKEGKHAGDDDDDDDKDGVGTGYVCMKKLYLGWYLSYVYYSPGIVSVYCTYTLGTAGVCDEMDRCTRRVYGELRATMVEDSVDGAFVRGV